LVGSVLLNNIFDINVDIVIISHLTLSSSSNNDAEEISWQLLLTSNSTSEC